MLQYESDLIGDNSRAPFFNKLSNFPELNLNGFILEAVNNKPVSFQIVSRKFCFVNCN